MTKCFNNENLPDITGDPTLQYEIAPVKDIRFSYIYEEDCTCCDGTGGSIGNEDPDDDWICDCCNGTGKSNRPQNPEPEANIR